MLNHTLILPDGDAKLAAGLLRTAIDDLDVVLMLVFGAGKDVEQTVQWANDLCKKTQITPQLNTRHVIWIRKPDVAPVREVLDPILGAGKTPAVAVLNFHDKLMAKIEPGEEIKPLILEARFAKGHHS